jgi:hypothetical protein
MLITIAQRLEAFNHGARRPGCGPVYRCSRRKESRSELLEFKRAAAYPVIMSGQAPRRTADGESVTPLTGPRAGPLGALLAAVSAVALLLLAGGRTGRIVINFSGGEKVRIERARFPDVSVSPPGK